MDLNGLANGTQLQVVPEYEGVGRFIYFPVGSQKSPEVKRVVFILIGVQV